MCLLWVISSSLDSDSNMLGKDQGHRLRYLVDTDALDFWEYTFIIIQTELLSELANGT